MTNKSMRDVLIKLAKRTYFNGSTDVVARDNGVIPNDTKLGEVQINAEVDQALARIEQIINERAIGEDDDYPIGLDAGNCPDNTTVEVEDSELK